MPSTKKSAKAVTGNRQPAAQKPRGRPRRPAAFAPEPRPSPEQPARTPKRKAPDHLPTPTQHARPTHEEARPPPVELTDILDQMKQFQASMVTRMVALEERTDTRSRQPQLPQRDESDTSDEETPPRARPTVSRPAHAARRPDEYSRPVTAPRRARKPARMPAFPEEYAETPYSSLHDRSDNCASVNRRKQFDRINEDDNDTTTNQAATVSELLRAAGNAMDRKPGKNPLLPHLFVIRGHKREKVAYGEATWHEYIAALCRMMNSSEVPLSWREPLLDHVHQLAAMAADWDWESCMWWSERVFTMIDDGRLPHAWADEYAVKDVQQDAFAIGVRTTARPQRTQATAAVRQTPSSSAPKTRQNSNTYTDNRQDFNKDTDGKPCHPWNWGGECAFSTTHGQMPDRKAHVCAWCANKYHRANVHKEMDCLNKKRFIEKKAAQGATTAQTADQGFC